MTQVRHPRGWLRIDWRAGVVAGLESDAGSVEFVRRADGRIVVARDDLGRAVGYDYDDRGRLAAATDLAGGRWRYRYGEGGALTAMVDARGKTVLAASHVGGRAATIRVLLAETTFHYGTGTTRAVDGLGRTTTFHRSLHHVRRIRRPGNRSRSLTSASPTTTAVYTTPSTWPDGPCTKRLRRTWCTTHISSSPGASTSTCRILSSPKATCRPPSSSTRSSSQPATNPKRSKCWFRRTVSRGAMPASRATWCGAISCPTTTTTWRRSSTRHTSWSCGASSYPI